MGARTFTPDWSNLPDHLLALIGKRLYTRIDILCFRAVCRSFRSALPRPSKTLFPDSILRKTDFLIGPNLGDDELFHLIEYTVYAIQPLNRMSNTHDETPQTWLIKVEESKPGRVKIEHPLYGLLRFKNLPEKLPDSLNLLDYRVIEINRSYALESAAIRKGKAKAYEICPRKPPVFVKVIFTSFLNESDDGFAVLARYDMGRKLGMWRNIDKKWSNIEVDLRFTEFFDIIYHNHKFYALISSGLTITVDSKSLTVTQVAAGLEEDLDFWMLHLVGSSKDLFMIAEFDNSGGSYCMVFKLDEENCEWVRLVDGLDLEDRVLFVGGEASYSFSAEEVSGFKGNCVYFREDDFKYNGHLGEDAWIFDLSSGKSGKLSDFPGYSNLFWPPPAWLKWH